MSRSREAPPQSDSARAQTALRRRFHGVRRFSETLCEPLEPEDCVIQSMTDVSPTRWHLAHTTWFFETFVLRRHCPGYQPLDADYEYLFNSYYNSIGEPFPRAQRGVLSRPTVAETLEYRRWVDEHILRMLADEHDALPGNLASVIELGLHHEQQHQELILTDIKHVFSRNPIWPRYQAAPAAATTRRDGRRREQTPLKWISYDEGLDWLGHAGPGFHFDNEAPAHRVFVESFSLASRLATNGEFLAFIEDGGYENPRFWLAEGWRCVSEEVWQAPLYWVAGPNGWREFTLGGLRPLQLDEPVCHVSYFEADAFARWSGARLPTEAQWEIAASEATIEGNFVETGLLHPTALETEANELPRSKPKSPAQMFGDVWEWTASPFVPYPGYQPPEGALGEYNGKFMCNQFVVRGGSCVTPRSHIRLTYRNFFPPDARWQFTGVRLAR